MISGLIIRPMVATDIPELLKMEEESPVWTEAQFIGELEQNNGWQYVAVVSSILGYICGRSVLDEAEIVKIAVKRDARKRGIATRLLHHSLDAAFKKGVRTCHLEVRQSNQPALNFYKKNDFFISGRRKYYYNSPKEDAVMMVKTVGDSCSTAV